MYIQEMRLLPYALLKTSGRSSIAARISPLQA